MTISRRQTFLNTIPVYDGDQLRGFTELDEAERAALHGRVDAVYNRRKHLKRVTLKRLCAHAVPLLAGGNTQSFEQETGSGRVWTLSLIGPGGRVQAAHA